MANALNVLSNSQHRSDVSRVRHCANKNMTQFNLQTRELPQNARRSNNYLAANCCSHYSRNTNARCLFPTLKKTDEKRFHDD